MRLVALPGVYTPRADTRMLLETVGAVELAPGARVLELCTGTGAVALCLAARGAVVTAVDRDLRAVVSARLNAALRGLPVKVMRGDLFEPIGSQRFDLVVCNPPYVPCDPATAGAALAWDAGPTGRTVLDRICVALADHLYPDGRAVLVQSSLSGVEESLQALDRGGLSAVVVRRQRGPLGPITAARADYLVRAGKLPATAGPHEEDLVVIEARSPKAQPGSPLSAPEDTLVSK